MKTAVAFVLFGHYQGDSRVRREAETLASRGYEVDVIALRDRPSGSTYTLQGVTVRQIELTQKRGGGLRYCYEYSLYCLIVFGLLGWLQLKKRYRVIHVNNMPDFLVFAAMLPKLFGAKIILDIHDPFPELYSIKMPNGKSRFASKMLVLEERLSIGFANHVITTSELIREAIIKRGIKPGKIDVILNSPNTSIFNPDLYDVRPPKDKFVLLYAGTITERCGLQNTIRAVAVARERVPGLMFRIIGSGDYVQELKNLITRLHLEDSVEICPSRPVTEIPKEYAAAHAVVWFADRNDFMDIIVSVKVLEGQAMGLPVASTHTPSHEYYFKNENVIFIESLETMALSDTIIDIYTNYSRLKPTRSEVARVTSRFSWKVEGERYVQIMESLMRPHSVAAVAGVREKTQ